MGIDTAGFKKLVKLASQPLRATSDKSAHSDDYTDKQTRLRKAEDTSVKPNDTSRPDSASTETKNLR